MARFSGHLQMGFHWFPFGIFGCDCCNLLLWVFLAGILNNWFLASWQFLCFHPCCNMALPSYKLVYNPFQRYIHWPNYKPSHLSLGHHQIIGYLTGAFYAGNFREWSINPQQPIHSLRSTSKSISLINQVCRFQSIESDLPTHSLRLASSLVIYPWYLHVASPCGFHLPRQGWGFQGGGSDQHGHKKNHRSAGSLGPDSWGIPTPTSTGF